MECCVCVCLCVCVIRSALGLPMPSDPSSFTTQHVIYKGCPEKETVPPGVQTSPLQQVIPKMKVTLEQLSFFSIWFSLSPWFTCPLAFPLVLLPLSFSFCSLSLSCLWSNCCKSPNDFPDLLCTSVFFSLCHAPRSPLFQKEEHKAGDSENRTIAPASSGYRPRLGPHDATTSKLPCFH